MKVTRTIVLTVTSVALLALSTTACSTDQAPESASATGPEATATASTAPSPTPEPSSPQPSPTPTPTPTKSTAKPTPPLPSLKGDKRNAFAYAPLDNPSKVKVEGSVSDTRAWSTSKVLVVLAFIKTVGGGNPDSLSQYWRDNIKLALTESDLNALLRIRAAIPGGSSAPMTQILRSIGDNDTNPPNRSEGSMNWSIRNQIRFMAALKAGKAVNKKTSRYVLNQMNPVPEHSWGLGTIGASQFKGGWYSKGYETDTRQMGIVGDYAVVIITDGDGPKVLQTDGDYAHVRQMNKLAKMLKKHLVAAQAS